MTVSRVVCSILIFIGIAGDCASETAPDPKPSSPPSATTRPAADDDRLIDIRDGANRLIVVSDGDRRQTLAPRRILFDEYFVMLVHYGARGERVVFKERFESPDGAFGIVDYSGSSRGEYQFVECIYDPRTPVHPSDTPFISTTVTVDASGKGNVSKTLVLKPEAGGSEAIARYLDIAIKAADAGDKEGNVMKSMAHLRNLSITDPLEAATAMKTLRSHLDGATAEDWDGFAHEMMAIRDMAISKAFKADDSGSEGC